MDTVAMRPVGVVRSAVGAPAAISLEGVRAVIEIAPEYAAALEKIEENSHLWVLAWFHEARRDVLATSPVRVNPGVPPYGVFALRSPARPNPIALTLVTLESVAANCLHVRGLDAVDGTAVLDIKPYYEQDIVFSPRTSGIVAAQRNVRLAFMEKEAFQHHVELCRDLSVAVRMGLVVEALWGKLNNDGISVSVTGSPCLADVVQGISRARLANPARFCYLRSQTLQQSVWCKGDAQIVLTMLKDCATTPVEALDDSELFHIQIL